MRSIKPPASAAERAGVSTVVFIGVEGYSFQNDTFGNIIFALEAVTMAAFVSEYRGELAESYRMSGAPGTWASDLDAAPRVLSELGVQAYVLSSSHGLSGWVLATSAFAVPANTAY